MNNIEDDERLAGYFCSCGKEGLAPGWDWHCTECHQDFTKLDETGARVGDGEAFYAHVCPPAVAAPVHARQRGGRK